MLKTFLSRLWQQVTQGFVRSQANDPVDEADSDIDRMNTVVWVGAGAEHLKLGPYIKQEDFKALNTVNWPNLSQDISVSPHFEKNLKFRKAYQKAVEAFLKHLGS
ncbi:hypothetical protein HRE53_29660 (plasmid) [Acaryochloris sp. 'Moss Beach']|uniref:hypothetical protein n=1 Tax=Acaryochloris sp. 'Moss Beach' TaxID=2740837 RepID=UPI001F3C428D|nr:hypothetical protein [Acaryochloris sp. 'Moss Beach']UJB72780.1 hypothetical protein HRE53_29660 [Acaryochloris sp. 'Moss Beach']